VLVMVLLLGHTVAREDAWFDTNCTDQLTMDRVGLEAVPAEIQLPADVCAQIVAAADQHGYSSDADSIDGRAVLDINVFNHGQVYSEEIYSLISPYLPGMKAALDRRFPELPNSIDWIFLRKYTAGTRRDSLRAHNDKNLHTINVPLNIQFQGGRLFFIPTFTPLGHAVSQNIMIEKYLVPDHLTGECNNTNYFFPHLPVGIGTIYNSSIWHGVTPMVEGSRYTLSYFYDEPKSVVKDSEQIRVSFSNRRKPHLNDPLPLSLYWVQNLEPVTGSDNRLLEPDEVHGLQDNDVVSIREQEWGYGDVHTETSYPGHVFAALGDDSTVVKLWRVHENHNTFELGEYDQVSPKPSRAMPAEL